MSFLIFRACKRGQFCPECNVVFGKEQKPDPELASCMVCQRQHHLGCVGQEIFICAGCQKKTLERCVGGGSGTTIFQQLAIGSGVTPANNAASGGMSSNVLGTPVASSSSVPGNFSSVTRTYSSRRQSGLPPISGY